MATEVEKFIDKNIDKVDHKNSQDNDWKFYRRVYIRAYLMASEEIRIGLKKHFPEHVEFFDEIMEYDDETKNFIIKSVEDNMIQLE